MSLLPFDDLFLRPSRLLDQQFGIPLDPEDIFSIPRTLIRSPAGYLRNWRPLQTDAGSTVTFDKNKFQASLDVQQFKPEEVTVKVTGDNSITVEGKHEEQKDEHGYISRHFVRRYVLPKNVDINKVETKLSSDGVLMITAPTQQEKHIEEKTIPIIRTDQPARIEQKKEGK